MTPHVQPAKLVTEDGNCYHMYLAKIVSTELGYEDHGVFTGILQLTYGNGGSQGAGLMSLSDYDPVTKRQVGTSRGHQWIIDVLRVVDCPEWELLRQHYVYALKYGDSTFDLVRGLANPINPESNYFIF